MFIVELKIKLSVVISIVFSFCELSFISSLYEFMEVSDFSLFEFIVESITIEELNFLVISSLSVEVGMDVENLFSLLFNVESGTLLSEFS